MSTLTALRTKSVWQPGNKDIYVTQSKNNDSFRIFCLISVPRPKNDKNLEHVRLFLTAMSTKSAWQPGNQWKN